MKRLSRYETRHPDSLGLELYYTQSLAEFTRSLAVSMASLNSKSIPDWVV